MEKDKYIRFDWAAKRILRDKANFVILEGLLNVLLPEQVSIVDILESEGNQDREDMKTNRVDIMARDSKGEYIIVEIQQSREIHYLERILFGVSKVIMDNMHSGQPYSNVKKVYSINIVYFPLGSGKDYLYHGATEFVGVHTKDRLEVTEYESRTLSMRAPKDVFPEYYIIRVNEFNDVARTPLEEWIEYLKSGKINDQTKAPGLKEARQRLLYVTMDEKEQRAYDRHLEEQVIQDDVLNTARIEGLAEGKAQGRAEGRAEGLEEGRAEGRTQGLEEGRAEGRTQGLEEGKAQGRAEGLEVGRTQGLEEGRTQGLEEGRVEGVLSTARNLLAMGIPPETIAQATGLNIGEIKKLC